MRKKMEEVQGQEPQPLPVAPSTPPAATVASPGSQMPTRQAIPRPTTAAPATTPGQHEAEMAAQNQAMHPVKQPKVKATPQTLPAASPLEPPPLPISNDKQQRLAELLRRYQADQVTPEQYQQERAKILAAP
jgi:hypothetical protein